jgi:hypothetical protein
MSYSFGKSIVTDGLVFYVDAGNDNSYPGSGTTWSNLAGSNDGTLTNGPTYNSANGGSIILDGVDDYVTFSEGGLSFPNNNDDFTLEVVLKLDAVSPQQTMFQQEDGGGSGRSWLFLRSNNAFSSFLGGSDLLLTSLGTPTVGTVYHVHVKYESGVLHIGYNGVWYQSSSRNIDENSTGGFRIGSGKNTSQPTNGNIYCVRVYDRALSASEITQNYNALKNRFI